MATIQTPERRYARQSTGWLLSHVATDARDLLTQELDAAKVEVKHQLDLAKKATVSAAIGGGVLAIAGIILAIALAELLALVLMSWAAFAIVGGALALIGGILLAVGGKKAAEVRPVPERTVREAKKDVQWIKSEAKSELTS